MSDLQDYIERSFGEEFDEKLLRSQWSDATSNHTIVCPCGQLRALELSFRCLYCGVFFCKNCAEKHFGKTIEEWVEHKKLNLH